VIEITISVFPANQSNHGRWDAFFYLQTRLGRLRDGREEEAKAGKPDLARQTSGL